MVKNDIIVMISSVMEASGQVVFDNLPLLFAVGTALGLAGGDGVAKISAASRLLNYECNNGESVAHYN